MSDTSRSEEWNGGFFPTFFPGKMSADREREVQILETHTSFVIPTQPTP